VAFVQFGIRRCHVFGLVGGSCLFPVIFHSVSGHSRPNRGTLPGRFFFSFFRRFVVLIAWYFAMAEVVLQAFF
jgi:hypothetical protein